MALRGHRWGLFRACHEGPSSNRLTDVTRRLIFKHTMQFAQMLQPFVGQICAEADIPELLSSPYHWQIGLGASSELSVEQLQVDPA